MTTFEQDRERLRQLNKIQGGLTSEQYVERKEVQSRLRAQGFYDKPKRQPEREDSEAEAMIQHWLDRY